MAQLDIQVATYDSVSKLAKIEIVNTNNASYSEVTLAIDSMPPVTIINKLGPGNSALLPYVVEPGKHSFVLKTKEGLIVEKTLEFSKTKYQIADEIENSETLWTQRQEELEKKSKEAQERLDELISEEVKKKEEAERTIASIEGEQPEKKYTTKDLIIGLSVLSLLIIITLVVFWFKKKEFKTEKIKEQNKKHKEDKT
jgi:hypothetical protein